MNARDWTLTELDRRIGLCRNADAQLAAEPSGRSGERPTLWLAMTRYASEDGYPKIFSAPTACSDLWSAHEPTSLAALYEWMRGEVGRHEYRQGTQTAIIGAASWFRCYGCRESFSDGITACPFVAGLASALGYPGGNETATGRGTAGARDVPPGGPGDGERGTPTDGAVRGDSEGGSTSSGPAAVAAFPVPGCVQCQRLDFGRESTMPQWHEAVREHMESEHPASREAPSAHAEGGATGRCRKAMWTGYGAPAGLCGEPAHGPAREGTEWAWLLEACPRHGGPDAPQAPEARSAEQAGGPS